MAGTQLFTVVINQLGVRPPLPVETSMISVRLDFAKAMLTELSAQNSHIQHLRDKDSPAISGRVRMRWSHRTRLITWIG